MTYPHLNIAPIREAVVDIRCQLPETLSTIDLLALHKEIAEQYPEKKPRRRLEQGFQIEGDVVETSTKHFGIDGFQFLSQESLQVVQFRLDGFTFSRLAPYPNWEVVRNEAKRLWKIYRNRTNPTSVSRIALRYINDLAIPIRPAERHRWQDWLTSPPSLPASLQSPLTQFLTYYQVNDVETKTNWNITQALQDRPSPADYSVLLDIDVYKLGNFENEEDSLWQTMEVLREIKNKVFFASVTERWLELFK